MEPVPEEGQNPDQRGPYEGFEETKRSYGYEDDQELGVRNPHDEVPAVS